MTKSKSLWVVALVLASLSVYSLTFAIETGWPTAIALATILVIAVVGLLFEKQWSQYLIYATLSLLILWSCYIVVSMFGPNWPYPDTLSTVFSLLPGVTIIMVFASSIIAVWRHFRSRTK